MSKRNAVTTFFTNRVTKALGMTLALMMTCQSAMASLAADQTRYIFRGDKDALTITVTNNDRERTFGGQAWVDNIVEKDTRPTFVVTPSFFKVKPNGQQTLRIIMASDHLPKDKESVYWLNLQDIPPSYDWNTVTIDAGTLPLSTELTNTSQKVVPTDKAVVWMPFDALKVKRYLLQVKQRDGEFVPGGTWARDSKNTPLGFVANNGVLMINTVDAPGDITLGQCRIPAAKLQDTEKLQEITCE
ncbi:fimbria/pilus periplasmic chaperone [Escherichia coli]|nr:fimbria/pilus periplasmic chaperone [Escherichia coli]